MSSTLRVLWTAHSTVTEPRPVLRCSRCDQQRAFASSGKFRLNANGRRLDAWLVYRCVACAASWNRPVFERRRRSEVDDGLLAALHGNDPRIARSVAMDVVALSRWAVRIEDTGGAPSIGRIVLAGDPLLAARIEIVFACRGAQPRMDRLLASGLAMSRTRLVLLAKDGRIETIGGRKALGSRTRDGAVLSMDLSGLPDGVAIALAAAGWAGAGED